MIRNYIKIAWRNIWKNKLFSVINILSLAIGLSASFVIGMMVYYDFTFDKFHADGDRIYRVTSDYYSSEGVSNFQGVAAPLGGALQEGATGVETVSSFFLYQPLKVEIQDSGSTYRNPEYVILADEYFFDLFNYKWLAGTKTGAMENPNEVVLTANRAKRYFAGLSPQEIVGKTITYNDSIPAKVIGVVENFKERTDFVFEEFISFPTAAQTEVKTSVFNESWNSTNSATQLFVKLENKASQATLQRQLDGLADKHASEEDKNYGFERRFNLQPLEDIHLSSDYGIFDFTQRRASRSVLIGLGLIALFLLLLGCINFVNLSTAQSLQRAKEIGIRKTLGGSRKQLVLQFLAETFYLTLIAAILSLVLASWFLRVFSDFIPPGLNLHLLLNPWLLFAVLLLLIIVSLVSGIYPALVLSHFQPVSVLKNQLFSGNDKTSLRKVLIVFQFVIAQVFIIATLLVSKQIQFMMAEDMGFKTEAVAYIRTPWEESSISKKRLFVEKLKAVPGINAVSLGGAPPASNTIYSTVVDYIKGDEKINIDVRLAFGDLHYLDLYDIPLLAGRNKLNDTIREYIINETMLKRMGLQSPQEALGQSLIMDKKPHPIVGVVQDFNQRSLEWEVEPLILMGDRDPFPQFNTIHFSFLPDAEVTAVTEDIWQEIYPESDFNLDFMDDTIMEFYAAERSMNHLLNWATGLSILISCLGLVGLVIYTTERRRKEVGIHKVLGATIFQINFLMSKEFLLLVGVAFLIAAPIAWWGLTKWLQDFAYKTDLSWWLFGLSGLGMALIAITIMSVITMKTAMENPVKSLRTE